jgi:branched-chain amino acid transport system ATP-binding protein
LYDRLLRAFWNIKPNDRAALGIGRTLQNQALFDHMSVLDNIMAGRLTS